MSGKSRESIQGAEDLFLSNLELLDDRLLQYEYLLSFIDELDELQRSECCVALKVEGCSSNAWMELSNDSGLLSLRMTADSLIIKGLLGVLSWILNGRPVGEVAAWQPRLLQHPQLKPQLNVDRRRGIASTIMEIQAFAAECGRMGKV